MAGKRKSKKPSETDVGGAPKETEITKTISPPKSQDVAGSGTETVAEARNNDIMSEEVDEDEDQEVDAELDEE
uniref:Uncharacterized protein n=1 Tax=Arundo donax TaxID=35708 RepID=A0A0A9H017_ARUDO